MFAKRMFLFVTPKDAISYKVKITALLPAFMEKDPQAGHVRVLFHTDTGGCCPGILI